MHLGLFYHAGLVTEEAAEALCEVQENGPGPGLDWREGGRKCMMRCPRTQEVCSLYFVGNSALILNGL